ncbi:hypothetical protein Holit_01612 [Hollandina sp. SP2]
MVVWRSECPSNSWIYLRDIPRASRREAKECRLLWGTIFRPFTSIFARESHFLNRPLIHPGPGVFPFLKAKINSCSPFSSQSFLIASYNTISNCAIRSFFPLVGPNSRILLSKACQDLRTRIFGVCQSRSSGLRAKISLRRRPAMNIALHTASSIVSSNTSGLKSFTISSSVRAHHGYLSGYFAGDRYPETGYAIWDESSDIP